MQIIKLDSKNYNETILIAKNILEKNGLVVFPTETMYGIGADATNEKSIQKLLEFKSKREGKPLSIVCENIFMAERYVFINEEARKIYETFLPGPVTVVSKGKKNSKLSEKIFSQTGTIGIRIPKYQFVLDLVKSFQKPFTATSSNPSGGKRPYSVLDILEQLSEKQKNLIDLIVDAGDLPKNPPSTIIDTTVGSNSVLRNGKIDLKFSKEFKSKSENETFIFAKDFMNSKKFLLKDRCVIFALEGEMGAGKTIFSKGIGASLGIKEIIKSPTYNFYNEYNFEFENKKSYFFHIDTWRISNEEELNSLEFEKMIQVGNVISVEWADKFSDEIEKFAHKSAIFWINIQNISENLRNIKF